MSALRRKTPRALGALLALGGLATAGHAGVAGPENALLIDVNRADDLGTIHFLVAIDLELPTVPDAVAVTVTPPGGAPLPLDFDGPGLWAGELAYPTLAMTKTALTGPWLISVVGPAPSTSMFMLDLATAQEADFHPVPTITAPTHLATGVAPDIEFQWTDPTGAETADVLFVYADGDTFGADALSLDGGISLGATSWNPPGDLPDGPAEFGVGYVDIDDLGRAGGITPLVGSITWGRYPLAPITYPSGVPLLLFGSEAIIAFEIGDAPVCPADTDGSGGIDVTDLVNVILDWGTDGAAHGGDVDGSGTVDVSDLVAVILGWGPC